MKRITYPRKDEPYYASFVAITNPTVRFQKILINLIKSEIDKDDFLRSTEPNNACCVYYVESAIDFHPRNKENAHDIFDYIIEGLVFKKARRGEHLMFKRKIPRSEKHHKYPTYYLGKRKIDPEDKYSLGWDIDWRNHRHGLRVYRRPIKGAPKYVRLEYIANKERLKKLRLRKLIDLHKITPDAIRPL